MLRTASTVTIAAALSLAAALPAAAQFSDSFNWLKAVRDRDGDKATDMLKGPSTTIVDTRDQSSGDTALHIVARRRDAAWLGFLLSNGANPNARNATGDTPLLTAARIGFADGIQALIGRRAQVDLANQAGETPLILAVQNRDTASARLLLAAGADPRRSDSVAGLSARDYAERDGRSGAILRLMDEAPIQVRPRDARPVAGPN